MTTTAKKTALLYGRVSSQHQARPEATSLTQQIERGEAYAASQGWEVIGRAVDEGVSGTVPLKDRPAGKELLTTDADAVIMWSVDRLTRSASRGLTDIEAMEDRGTALCFLKESLDTSTPAGKLFRGLLANFSEFERAQIMDRSMSGRFGAAAKGRWSSGALPYGYALDSEKAIVIEEAEAAVVRLMFDLRCSGESPAKVAKTLNSRGHWPRERNTETPKPPRWTATTVRRMLAAEVYAGRGIVRAISPAKDAVAKTFHYDVPALVDAATWKRAQKPILGRKRSPQTRRNTYALGGRVYHDHDGTLVTMFGQTPSNGAPAKHRCGAAWDAASSCPGLGTAPNGKTATAVRADWAAGGVLFWLFENVDTGDKVLDLLNREAARLERIKETNAEDRLRADLEDILGRKHRWQEMFGDGLITKEGLVEKLKELDPEEGRLRADLEGHEAERAAYEDVIASLEDILAITVEDTGGDDPARDEDPTRGSKEWRYRLSEEGFAAYTAGTAKRNVALSEWATEELAYIVKAIDLRVTVTASGDWLRPNLALEIPAISKALSHKRQVASSK